MSKSKNIHLVRTVHLVLCKTAKKMIYMRTSLKTSSITKCIIKMSNIVRNELKILKVTHLSRICSNM